MNEKSLEEKRMDDILKKYNNSIDSKVHEDLVKALFEEEVEYSLEHISRNYIEAFKDIKTDTFWIDRESELLGAIIGYIKNVYQENSSKRNLNEIVNFLIYNDFVNYQNASELFELNNIKGEALELWNNYLEFTQSKYKRYVVGLGLIQKIRDSIMVEGIKNKKAV